MCCLLGGSPSSNAGGEGGGNTMHCKNDGGHNLLSSSLWGFTKTGMHVAMSMVPEEGLA